MTTPNKSLKIRDIFSEVNLPSIGTGTCRPSATYIALLASLEGCREDAISALATAAEELGISGAEIEHAQHLDSVPGLGDEVQRRRYDLHTAELKRAAKERFGRYLHNGVRGCSNCNGTGEIGRHDMRDWMECPCVRKKD